MVVEKVAPTDIDSEKVPEMSHALGWCEGVALCGTRIVPRAPKRGWKDCVVCNDLWRCMSEGERRALEVLHGNPA